MNILFFTQYFFPENFRINELVSYFYNKKNKCTVLTGYPSYPNKKLFLNKKLLPKKLKKKDLIRVPVFKRGNNNFSIILNYISFFLSSFLVGITKIFNRKFDIIFIYSPSPILTAIPAILLSKIFKKKVVIWILDLWPNTIVDLGLVKNKYLIKFLKTIVNFIYRNCHLILAQSNSIKKEIKKSTNTKCIYFPSWSEENIYKKKNKKINIINNLNKNIVKIIFAGNIGEAQSLETLVKSVYKLRNKNFIVIIIGEGRWKSKILEQIKNLNINDKFIFISQVPNESIGFFLQKADALYLSLKKNKTFSKTIPGKLQTYMSISKPIIGSISGETNRIIKKNNCGLTSNAENIKELQEIIQIFLKLSKKKRNYFAKNGKIFSKTYFNKYVILKNLKNEIKNLI